MIKGIKASSGIAIGTAFVVTETKVIIVKETTLTVDQEKNRLKAAKDKALNELEVIRIKTLETIGESESEVFEAHKQLLQDPVMEKEVVEILNDSVSAEYAFETVIDKYIEMFKNLDNAYMKERALDLKDIKTRLINILMGVDNETTEVHDNAIIVTFDLTPSETVNLDRSKTIGFVTEIGGETSHSAIIARTMNIPAVVGIGEAINQMNNGDLLILDGENGLIFINPNEPTLNSYKEKQVALEISNDKLKMYLDKPSITTEGKIIEIAGNIAAIEDVHAVIESSGDGIGLFRSEFLYMNRTELPSEDEQFEAYKYVLEHMNPKPVTIRTMDIGGDKNLDYLNLDKEMNPFLGYRAIRICLKEEKIFKDQLRALYRASVFGRLRIMFPMISCLEEILEVKEILSKVKSELISEGVSISDNIEIGIMIEVPAAALIADFLAEEVDFFSIGTNDLIQYTTAVDRMNSNIADLYSPYHPAFIRLIKQVIDAGHKAGIEVGMCGNVAGTPDIIPLLLDLGLDEFSMSPNMILKARSIINTHKKAPLEAILACKTKKEIEHILKAE